MNQPGTTQLPRRVAALYVEPDGVYSTMGGIELWDEQRDARQYDQCFPVVAHPPCQRWGKYATKGGRTLGDDHGCGQHAINAVRAHGGVMEHPAHSWLFAAGYLPKPGHSDLWGGRTVEINQADYGHLALKPTWLYICSPVELRNPQARREQLRPLENLSYRQRIATPPLLAAELVRVALLSRLAVAA